MDVMFPKKGIGSIIGARPVAHSDALAGLVRILAEIAVENYLNTGSIAPKPNDKRAGRESRDLRSIQ
jgi:hypothetical protein